VALARAAQVHVGSFPAHHPQQPTFILAARLTRQLDATAVGREAADEPGAGRLANRSLRPPDNCRSNADLWSPYVAVGAQVISSSAWLDFDRSW